MRRTAAVMFVATALISGRASAEMPDAAMRQAMLEARQNAYSAAQYEECGLNSDGLKKVLLDHLRTACGASGRQLGEVETTFDHEVATRSTELERRGLSCQGSEADARASFDSQLSRLADQLRGEKC